MLRICVLGMTSEREQGNGSNPFLNLMGLWQNYLIEWIEMNRNLYENVISDVEQWLKAIWEPSLKTGNPSQRETVKVE
jgi:hypothetical protein